MSSGETYDAAFVREVKEEIGLDVSKMEHKKLGQFSPYKHGVSSFMAVYEVFVDVAPDYNKEDFTEFYWLFPQEILDRVRSIDISKPDLPKLIEYFFKKNKENIIPY